MVTRNSAGEIDGILDEHESFECIKGPIMADGLVFKGEIRIFCQTCSYQRHTDDIYSEKDELRNWFKSLELDGSKYYCEKCKTMRLFKSTSAELRKQLSL